MILHIVITAGGTTESIDAVRTLNTTELLVDGAEGLSALSRYDISNISKGGFALEIALACVAKSTAEQSVQVTLIAKQELARELAKNPPAYPLEVIPFRSFADLRQAIDDRLARGKIEVFFMAAAVSDYSPIAVSGKISSQEDELIIRLKKNEKLLDKLRVQLGEDCCLVGFKLLAGVSCKTLVSIAHAQNVRCGCNLTVANDAAQIDWTSGWHPVVLVGREGLQKQINGLRPEVSKQIVDQVFELLRS